RRHCLADLGWNGGRHVGENAGQSRRLLQSHLLGDRIAPIAALRHVARISEAVHQNGPGARDALRIPAGRGWLARLRNSVSWASGIFTRNGRIAVWPAVDFAFSASVIVFS